jgi:SNF2 family DNA or RNA helicase
MSYCYLDGASRDRAAIVREFDSGAAPIFLISLKAGGFGLNLTQADYCFLLDPPGGTPPRRRRPSTARTASGRPAR